MKKILSLILVLVMMVSLVACGNSGETEQNAGEKENAGSNEQVAPAETEGGNQAPAVSTEITLEILMKAPESPESDFECVDHGDGDVELLRYLGNSEIVVIPATWNGKEITTVASYVFANDSTVRAIRLSDSVKTLEGGACGLNTALEIFVCGEGLEVIGEGAFQNCTNLREIVLNNGLIKLDPFCLSGSDHLMSVEIPETVTEIDYTAFYIVPDGFTLVGAAGSYAEEYANSEGLAFKAK